MDAKKRKIQRWAIDPFCPIDWRFQDAKTWQRANGRTGRMPTIHWSSDCAEYLKAMDSRQPAANGLPCGPLAVDPSRVRVGRRLQPPASRESRLGCWPAKRTSRSPRSAECSPGTVDCFEQLFFSVRHRLRAIDCLMKQTIGPGVHQGFRQERCRPSSGAGAPWRAALWPSTSLSTGSVMCLTPTSSRRSWRTWTGESRCRCKASSRPMCFRSRSRRLESGPSAIRD